ncbi:glycosyl transferase family 2 [Dysgonomonas alginatilytica]|uniref:Glycosyl transferase family 2 n=1 Tax=Dysgonomonas alginatilytica TaxID=1605892 RepID=A0A2V3PZV9_9BACT|nr:glycosyltransferase family 2 protein [Dysgonomonas alginatilytica]PXV68065.1 glycosyl transferase family 2 [Dysgonomonas alginatilytica]
MNKISIITVNRNNADGLEKTIKSVIKQTYTNYEFIIIDGASTDNSVDIIKQYSSKISFWISEKDTGIFNAMNKGINRSTGDYCYFLNSADTFADDNVLKDIFETQTYTAPFINGHQINDFGSYTQKVPCLNRNLTLFDFYWGTIKHQATFIRRDLFDTYGLYDESLKITSDWKFFLQTIGLHNEQPLFIDVDIVLFEWNGLSTNPELTATHKNERTLVLDEYIPRSIQSDYEHFHEMSDYKYIVDVMKKNRVFTFLVKVLVKVFK